MSFDYDGALRRVQKKWIAKAAKVVEDEAARRAPIDDGGLRGSISSQASDTVGEVGANIEYAAYVEYGTRPHFPPLAPLKRWAQKNLGSEKAAYPVAKKIAQKGTKAQPFMRPAVDNNKKQLTQDFRKMLDDEYREEARRGKR